MYKRTITWNFAKDIKNAIKLAFNTYLWHKCLRKRDRNKTLFLKLKTISTKIDYEISETSHLGQEQDKDVHYLCYIQHHIGSLAKKKNISIQNRNEKTPSSLKNLSLFVDEINI